MKLLALAIRDFRGITRADVRFGHHSVLVGPNGVGKSSIVDALSLVFGRIRLVRELTEHDFYGSCPTATSRIRIVATLSGFAGNDPGLNDSWFRDGRAVPKWWNPVSESAEPEPSERAAMLCAQIAFAARFDLEELAVESIRYFHDDDAVVDPFVDDAVQQVPTRLFDDIGYYVLPARRTWEAAASFASELFRKTVATVGGIPAQTILNERDRLRQPEHPLEETADLAPLVGRINKQLAALLPAAPRFQLRVTATDADSLLRGLVPHYAGTDNIALPVGRHGMGLLSLQTFILILELGRERVRQGKPFLFAMEEPELHIPPGMQRRLIAQALSTAEQTICTSHSPRLAAYYPATSIQILSQRGDCLTATPLLRKPLEAGATNARRKLYHEDRSRVIEALMHHRVLIPEGRSEYEWFRLLSDTLEMAGLGTQISDVDIPPFGSVVGVTPTHDGAVAENFEAMRTLRDDLVVLVDGDAAGNEKIQQIQSSQIAPSIILQWRSGWAIEDVIGWILEGAEQEAAAALRLRLEREFQTIGELMTQFKAQGPGRLKTDYLAYEEIASVIASLPNCFQRAESVLKAVTLACLGQIQGADFVRRDEDRSNGDTIVLRLGP